MGLLKRLDDLERRTAPATPPAPGWLSAASAADLAGNEAQQAKLRGDLVTLSKDTVAALPKSPVLVRL